MNQFLSICPADSRQTSWAWPKIRWTGPVPVINNGPMERLNIGEDLLRIRMQLSHPPRALTIKAPQSEFSGKVHEDRVEGSVTINVTPGAEGRQTRPGGIPFVQEPITGGVKQCGSIGGRVFDHHRETADQEVRRVENDQFIFPGDSLGGVSQRRVCGQQQRLTLTLNQSVS